MSSPLEPDSIEPESSSSEMNYENAMVSTHDSVYDMFYKQQIL